MAVGHNIADGQVASAKGTIYTAGADEVISALTFVNTHSSSVTLNVFINRSGTSRRIFPEDMTLNVGAKTSLDCANEKHILESGDTIEASDGQGSVTDFTVSTFDLP